MLRYRSQGLLTSGGDLPYNSRPQVHGGIRNALPDHSGKDWHVFNRVLVE